MKIYLLSDCTFYSFDNTKSTRSTFHTVPMPDTSTTSKFEKFQQTLNRQSVNRTLTVEFGLNDVQSETWNITLEGDILAAIHQLIYYGDKDTDLQITLTIICMRTERGRSYENVSQAINGFCSEKVVPNEEETGNKIVYVKNNVTIPKNPYAVSSGSRWNLTLEINGSDYIHLEDILPSVSVLATNQHIYQNKQFCDLEIVCNDGTVIPCHKAFICAKSVVLTANLERDFKEKQENKLKISDMSTEGVQALIAFMYCNDIRAAVKCCGLALELLIAADKYDIAILWKAVSDILLLKNHSLFDTDVALTLFDFVSKCERNESDKLKHKMVEVLAVKRDQLSSSKLYKDIFTTEMSREILNMTLNTYKK